MECSISLSRKVNLGNYESCDVFMSISGVTSETTESDINELLDGTASVAYKAIAKRLKEKLETVKG